MDKGKIYEYLPLIVMIAGIVAGSLPIIPHEIRGVSQFIAIGFSVVAVVAVDYGIRMKAAEYLYIEAICRPSQKKLYLWITEPKEGINSKLINPETNTYQTPLDLGREISYGMYEDVNKIDLEHELPWGERMIFMPVFCVVGKK